MELRRARMQDVPTMIVLINYYAEKGLMLPRSANLLYQTIRDFIVVVDNNKIVGVGGLHTLWSDLAEIRSLAIEEEYMKNGLGKNIVDYFLDEAKQLGISKVFTLTYQPGFFEKCGFTRIDKEELPQKVWQDCIHCIKFPNCDEIAMITRIQ